MLDSLGYILCILADSIFPNLSVKLQYQAHFIAGSFMIEASHWGVLVTFSSKLASFCWLQSNPAPSQGRKMGDKLPNSKELCDWAVNCIKMLHMSLGYPFAVLEYFETWYIYDLVWSKSWTSAKYRQMNSPSNVHDTTSTGFKIHPSSLWGNWESVFRKCHPST